MEEKNLDELFEEAVKKASRPNMKFPADVKLCLYAYYKHAMGGHSDLNRYYKDDIEGNTLISGFKINALFQAKVNSITEAKKKYIEVLNAYLKKESENK